jgi:hypothetical protein
MADSAVATTSRSSVDANSASEVIANVHRNRDREFIGSLHVARHHIEHAAAGRRVHGIPMALPTSYG